MYWKILVLILPMCLADVDHHKQTMIKQNKTPKQKLEIKGACDECKVLIGRLDEALKDPEKLSELQNLLSLLCLQAPENYRVACKLVVGQLPQVAHEIEPFLQNPTELCGKLHLCGNPRLERIHRLSLVYAKKYLNRIDGVSNNDMLCEECEFAAKELKSLLEEKDIQHDIQDFLHNYICKNLGQYSGSCDELVEQFLPELFEELESMLQNSKQVCVDLGLCSAQSLSAILIRGQPMFPADYTFKLQNLGVDHNNLPRNRDVHRFTSFARLLNNLQTKKGVYMSCYECKLGVDALLDGLKEDSVQQDLANDIQDLFCDRLPDPYRETCDDFFGTYLKTMVKIFVDEQSTGKICKLVHVCTNAKFRTVVGVNRSERDSVACESCKGLTDFLRRELTDQTFISDITQYAETYICPNLPKQVQNICDNLAQTYIPNMIAKLRTYLNSETICKDDLHMCTYAMIQEINGN